MFFLLNISEYDKLNKAYECHILTALSLFAGGMSFVSGSEDVTSSHNHASLPITQSIDQNIKSNNMSSRPTHRLSQYHSSHPNEIVVKAPMIEDIGVPKNLTRDHLAGMISNMDQVRAFYGRQDPAAIARSNYSPIDVLCQIFPGRSKSSLESLLRVSPLNANNNPNKKLIIYQKVCILKYYLWKR